MRPTPSRSRWEAGLSCLVLSECLHLTLTCENQGTWECYIPSLWIALCVIPCGCCGASSGRLRLPAGGSTTSVYTYSCSRCLQGRGGPSISALALGCGFRITLEFKWTTRDTVALDFVSRTVGLWTDSFGVSSPLWIVLCLLVAPRTWMRFHELWPRTQRVIESFRGSCKISFWKIMVLCITA